VYIFDIFVLKTKITIKISPWRNFIKNLTCNKNIIGDTGFAVVNGFCRKNVNSKNP